MVKIAALMSLVICFLPWHLVGEVLPTQGELIYQNDLSSAESVKDWVMEGPGELAFSDGWMEMWSPEKEYHHVFWCPEDFPDHFIAVWEMQNLDPEAGLCIIFFATQGLNGEDIFDPTLPERNGTFRHYNNGALRCYHISYYTNTPSRPDRGKAHLRKNDKFRRVQEGANGIPADSTEIHQVKLIKNGPHILLFVDERKVIDWLDTPENEPRPPYKEGKMGFRQMKWTHFRYRNFRVYGILEE